MASFKGSKSGLWGETKTGGNKQIEPRKSKKANEDTKILLHCWSDPCGPPFFLEYSTTAGEEGNRLFLRLNSNDDLQCESKLG